MPMSFNASQFTLEVGSAIAIGAILFQFFGSLKPFNSDRNIVSKTNKEGISVDDADKVYPDEIVSELYSRVETYFDPIGLSKIRNSFIVVINDSYCANF